MPRSAATLDSFNAVAEPRRREMLGMLSLGERPVNDIVNMLGWPQPVVSKHLRVLLTVGLVNMRRDGRQRFYSVNGEKLKTIHDWVTLFERFWRHQLDRIKDRAEAKVKEQKDLQKNIQPPDKEQP